MKGSISAPDSHLFLLGPALSVLSVIVWAAPAGLEDNECDSETVWVERHSGAAHSLLCVVIFLP